MTNLVQVMDNNNNQVVTTSRQIAETFGKEHKHVMRDIRNLLKKDVSKIKPMFYESTQPDSYGRPQKVYLINRDGFSLLVMGFTGDKALEFKLQYIEAFNVMEKQIKENLQLNVPQNYKEALQLLLEQEERKEQLKLEVLELRPKADYTDTILNNQSVVTTTQVAADYGLGVVTFNKLLYALRIVYKVSGQWVLYANHQGKGYTQSKTPKLSEGQRAQPTTHWTQEGRFFLHKVLTDLGFYPSVAMPPKFNPKRLADSIIYGLYDGRELG